MEACQIDAASFGRKQRPVTQSMDGPPWGATMPADMQHLTPADVFVMSAIRHPKDKQSPLVLSPVSMPAMARAQAFGISLAGKSIALDHDGVIHTIRSHGESTEAARGQVPISPADVALWAEIFNLAQLKPGNPPKAKDGALMLSGETEIGGWVYGFAAKVRRLHVVPYTLFKRKRQ